MSPTDTAPDILVVDDTTANLQLLAEMLRRKRYKVRPVTSGRAALQAARSKRPDLVLLDISMPEMDGYEVCTEFKRDEQLKDVPILFLSALSEALDKVRAFACGGVDYITKPFQFEEVESRVQTHLRLHQAEAELKRQLLELRALEAQRDNLIHMVVHDMRSPLQALVGGLDLLQSQEPVVGLIARAAQRLTDMVDTLLDINKLEAGELTLSLVPFDGLALLEEVASLLKPAYPRHQVILTGTAAPIFADRALFSRVVQNLLANALSFSAETQPIHLTLTHHPERVTLEVQDSGPGIEPSLKPVVFDKFRTGGLRGRKKSTGLGLAFCKLAVEAHGGRIGVESELGRGCRFWVELPVQLGSGLGVLSEEGGSVGSVM